MAYVVKPTWTTPNRGAEAAQFVEEEQSALELSLLVLSEHVVSVNRDASFPRQRGSCAGLSRMARACG
jgi:hypothetical protein